MNKPQSFSEHTIEVHTYFTISAETKRVSSLSETAFAFSWTECTLPLNKAILCDQFKFNLFFLLKFVPFFLTQFSIEVSQIQIWKGTILFTLSSNLPMQHKYAQQRKSGYIINMSNKSKQKQKENSRLSSLPQTNLGG